MGIKIKVKSVNESKKINAEKITVYTSKSEADFAKTEKMLDEASKIFITKIEGVLDDLGFKNADHPSIKIPRLSPELGYFLEYLLWKNDNAAHLEEIKEPYSDLITETTQHIPDKERATLFTNLYIANENWYSNLIADDVNFQHLDDGDILIGTYGSLFHLFDMNRGSVDKDIRNKSWEVNWRDIPANKIYAWKFDENAMLPILDRERARAKKEEKPYHLSMLNLTAGWISPEKITKEAFEKGIDFSGSEPLTVNLRELISVKEVEKIIEYAGIFYGEQKAGN